ncbi:electron transfer flavoprotein subunit beta/FixA family protein [Thermodesulfobacteriota bacterium]
MKIVVCVKQIAHTYARTGNDPEKHYLAEEDNIFRINPCDELAVGMAIHARELFGEGEISLLTLGPLTAEAELRRCMALGADSLCQIDMADPMDPWQKSVFLGRAVRELGADLVFCGTESLDSRNGQVGALLAHHLDMPFVSCVREMVLLSIKGSVQVQRSAGRGVREVVECPLPAVLGVDPGAGSPLLPTYDEKKKCRTIPIQKFIYDISTVSARYKRIRIYPPRPRPKTVASPDSRLGAYERISRLLSGSLVEKKGEMLTGDPASQAERMISFMKTHDLLEIKNKEMKG